MINNNKIINILSPPNEPPPCIIINKIKIKIKLFDPKPGILTLPPVIYYYFFELDIKLIEINLIDIIIFYEDI
jgi:hypothetical protein